MTSATDTRGGNAAVSRLARGSSLAILGTGLSQFSLVLIVALLAAKVGTSGVGVYTQAYAILTLCVLVGLLGMQTTLTRYVANHLVSGEVTAIRALVRWGILIPMAAALALGALIVALAHPIGVEVLHDPNLVFPLQMVGLSIPSAVYAKAAAAVLQGYNNMRDFVMITLVLEPAVRLLLTAAVLIGGGGLHGAAIALVVSNLTSAIWARHRLHASIPRFAASTSYPWQALVRFSVVTWVASLATTGLLWADTLIIGALKSSSDVGVYQVATRVLALATLASVPIASAFAPRIAELVRTGRLGELQTAYSLTTTWATRLSVPLLALCAIAPHQLLSVFGAAYATAAAVTVVLAVGKLVESATGPCGMVLNMSSRVGLNAANNVLGLTLNIVMNLLLIPRYGLVGAAISWSVALVVVNVARVVEVHLVIGLRLTEPRAVRAVLAVVPAAGVAVLVRQPLHGPLSLLVQAAVLVLGYVVTLRLWDWSDEDDVVLRSLVRSGRAQAAGPVAARVPAGPAPVHAARPDAGLPLWTLISPLRFDILVRADFFRFIERHEQLYDDDRAAFMTLARADSYYQWYRKVASQHERWPLRADDHAFERRVDHSVHLLRSYRVDGFDDRHPITVWSTEQVLPTKTGKLVERTFFMGDGCHRLALLINSGAQALVGRQYRVHHVAALSPRDNTGPMLGSMNVGSSDYLSFIAMGYGLVDCPGETPEDLLARLPESQRVEVAHVLNIDLLNIDLVHKDAAPAPVRTRVRP